MTELGTDVTSGRRPLREVWVVAMAALATTVLVAGFWAFATAEGVPFKFLSKEPAETLDVPRFIGWQADTVVLIEAGGAACALLGWLLLRRLHGDRTQGRFLLGVGLFTVLLVCDDFLQFHESVYPALFHVHEQFVYPVYGLIIVSILWFWGRHVVHHDRIMMLLSGMCMATSVAVDTFGSKHFLFFNLIEDGAKQLGLTLWTLFLVRAAIRYVVAAATGAVATTTTTTTGVAATSAADDAVDPGPVGSAPSMLGSSQEFEALTVQMPRYMPGSAQTLVPVEPGGPAHDLFAAR